MLNLAHQEKLTLISAQMAGLATDCEGISLPGNTVGVVAEAQATIKASIDEAIATAIATSRTTALAASSDAHDAIAAPSFLAAATSAIAVELEIIEDIATGDETPPASITRGTMMGWALGAGIELGAMPLTDAGNTALGEYLDEVVESGSDWIRVACSWQNVQGGANPNPSYNWAAPDRLISYAQARGLKVILTISHCPRWAALNSAITTTSWRAPSLETLTEGGAWSVWCAAVATRYGVGSAYADTVKWFEIWNEPNLKAFWQGESPNVNKYIAMLTRAYDAIKAVNSANQVMNAGLAGIGNADAFGSAIIDSQKFDAFAHHPYPPMTVTYPSLVSDLLGPYSSLVTSNLPSIEHFRARLVATGQADKKIMCTETGYNTAAGNQVYALAGVDPVAQADGMEQIVLWWEAQTYTGLLIFHTFADPGTRPTNVEDMYGQYCTKDFVPKPGKAKWQALTAGTWATGGGPPESGGGFSLPGPRGRPQ
jgi:Cellulase (glycosyl hydrolase family 5)